MPILLIIMMSLAFADKSELKNLIDKSYTHDNIYCKMNGARVELQLRGMAKFSEPRERSYGEFAFYRQDDEDFKSLPLNPENLHSYRFFYGNGTICSKSFGFKLSKDTSVILFQKENRPYIGKLIILAYDHIKHLPKNVVETEYPTDEIIPFKNGFAFKIVPERDNLEMGNIKINDIDYTYQDRDFHVWMSYDLEGFKILPQLSYEKFPWKNHFKDEAEFFKTTGWDQKSQQFTNIYIYIAVNHKLKKHCLFISPMKVKINGSESWNCL